MMLPMADIRIVPRGPFSLAAASRFLAGFGPTRRDDPDPEGRLHLAFSLDGSGEPAGVSLSQPEPEGAIVGEVVGDAAPDAVRRQAERILSLDLDGSGFAEILGSEPVLGRISRDLGGLRPVQFPSPFEAAVWAVLSQRTRMAQAAAARRRLAERLGAELTIDMKVRVCFPAPGSLLEVGPTTGIPVVKAEWIRGLAQAALDGRLDADRLRAMDAEEALLELRALPGVGAFSAELILVRGAGAPDVLPHAEPRLRAAAALAYDLPAPPDDAQLRGLAEPWRPYRSWAALLLRARLAEETGPAVSRRGRR